MTLYEVCPTCKGTRLVTSYTDLTLSERTTKACPDCKDGFVEHRCSRDESCPCIEVYRHDHPDRET